MARLHIQRLTKAFGNHPVLRGVDLDVASGRLVAILGASGGGKTTLLRLICGFEKASGGVIQIGDEIVCGPGRHLPPEKRRIGYVAQEGALFPHLSVADNIAFGLSRQQRRVHYRVTELLYLVGLSAGFANRPPHALSGGEQQRVALARALARNPSLVLLDEPFSALDAALRVETRHAVATALSASGATALLVTHDQTEALSMGHQVAVLRHGVLAQVAEPEHLYRRPVDQSLAQFVGDAVLLPASARNGMADCVLGRVKLAPNLGDGEVELMLRPEQIRLSASQGDGSWARVCEVTFYGHDASVRLELCGAAGTISLTALVPGHASPKPGEVVGVSVQGEAMAYHVQSSRLSTAAQP